MKKIIILTIAFLGAFNFIASAQKLDAAKLPAAITASFANDFPGIKAKWEKENSNYEANFKQDGNEMSAVYDANGKKIESEKAIKIASLPAAVTTYVTENYKGEKIKSAAIITKANGEINYEAEVKGKDLLFTKQGKFISISED